MKDYKRILVIRTDRIGDVLLSTPVIKILRDKYPKSYIAFMVRPYAKDIIEGNPYLDEIIVYDKYGKERSFLSTLRFSYLLKRKNFDVALILHPTNRAHIMTFLAKIPERIGYDKKFSFLLTEKIKDLKHLGKRHEIDYNFDILKVIGIKENSRKLLMPLSENDKKYANSILLKNGITETDKIIVVHPAASCPSKMWSTERFGRICDLLIKRYQAKIILLSSKEDKEICRKVASFMLEDNYIILTGLKLKELAAILKKARLLISNDSGPVHISVAVDTPVIAVFGRNDPGLSPRRWGPVGKYDIILHKDVDCLKCLAHNCKKGFKCLKAISVEDVLNAAKRIQEDINY